MNRPRRLHWAAQLCAALLCSAAAGLGLGELEIASPLGEPLQAAVALRGVEQWSERQLSVTASAQLPGQPAERLNASFEQSMAGAALLISSRQRINAALFELQLTVHTPAGELQRSYSVALALPAVTAASRVPPLQPPAGPVASAAQLQPSEPAAPSAAPPPITTAVLAPTRSAPQAATASPSPIQPAAATGSRGRWWTAALIAAALLGLAIKLRARLTPGAGRPRRQPAAAVAAAAPARPRAAIAYVAPPSTPVSVPAAKPAAKPVGDMAAPAAAARSPLPFQLVETAEPPAAALRAAPSRRTISFDDSARGAQSESADTLAEQLAGCYDSLGEPQLAAALRGQLAVAAGNE